MAGVVVDNLKSQFGVVNVLFLFVFVSSHVSGDYCCFVGGGCDSGCE